jgi:3-deoxy-manno-octulosonate cytidylyltransferase (CMP-KDO synthetase)
MTEKTVIIIPARYGSKRFEGKPLAVIVGSTGVGRSLIQRSWDTACEVPGIDDIFVATDDKRIAQAVWDFGGQVIMTSDTCRNGTERVAEALQGLATRADIVVNLQGDALLTPPWFITRLIEEMKRDHEIQMATPVLKCDGYTLNLFLEDRRNGKVGGTTAVFDNNCDALYFSKEVLPFTEKLYLGDAQSPVYHHVGAYAYRPKALAQYLGWPEGVLETLEGLEQLRFLEQAVKVRCVPVEGKGRVFWELNNPVDVERIESVLKQNGCT